MMARDMFNGNYIIRKENRQNGKRNNLKCKNEVIFEDNKNLEIIFGKFQTISNLKFQLGTQIKSEVISVASTLVFWSKTTFNIRYILFLLNLMNSFMCFICLRSNYFRLIPQISFNIFSHSHIFQKMHR